MQDLSSPLDLGPPPPVFMPPLGAVAGVPPPLPSAGGATSSPAAPAQPPKPPATPASPPASTSPATPPTPPKAPSGAGGSSLPSTTTTPAKPPQTPATDKPSAPATAPQTGTLVFPLWIKPTASWKDGPRYFGAPRDHGARKHAGCDLYAPYLSKIRAIADGVVILSPYGFYDGTNALEVYHPGIGVVRYGEISSGKRIPLKPGEKVTAGQHIAYVGLLDSLQMSMIHFELFEEAARGQNLSGGGPYRRNSHLKNPTSLIDKLYKLTFG